MEYGVAPIYLLLSIIYMKHVDFFFNMLVAILMEKNAYNFQREVRHK